MNNGDMPMMTCGHTANGYRTLNDGTKKPVCIICDCDTVAKKEPDLAGRVAKCAYCGRTRPSDSGLAFFASRPDNEYDSYYDGCMGWD